MDRKISFFSNTNSGNNNCGLLFIVELKNIYMPIVKVIEVIASSDKSIEDALQQAVTEAWLA
jgi:hypothetical protein